MRKNILIRLSLLLLFLSSAVIAQIDPLVSSVINQVNIDTLYENLRSLTGEKDVTISSGTYRITSRHANQFTNIVAEDYLNARFKNYGLSSSVQYFTGSGGNVIAVQEGVKYPDQQIIICAHFDDMPSSYIAPGADDNGSGTSAVIEAARILSKYKTDYTIIYALWDNEELGLLGSKHYAQLASSKNDKIIAVINMDMIGWDSNNDYLAEIHSQPVSSTYQLVANMTSINSTYGIGLKLFEINPGTTASDHSPFWTYNYPAILLIENYTTINNVHDFNLYYHTQNDVIQYINKPFYERCAKLAIGTLASYAGISQPTSVVETKPTLFSLSQNYPNPFNPETTIRYKVQVASKVSLKVYDILGREVAILVNEWKEPGTYNSKFSIRQTNSGQVLNSEFSSGIYFYVLNAGDFSNVKKMVLAK